MRLQKTVVTDKPFLRPALTRLGNQAEAGLRQALARLP